MIIIINGSVGVGKTSVSRELVKKFEKAVMLDGDYFGAVHPFEIYDSKRITYLYETMAHMLEFHMKNGYKDFVINYIFENNEQLRALMQRLKFSGQSIYCYYLLCCGQEQKQRILNRNTDQVEWELKRSAELNAILNNAHQAGYIGDKVETSQKECCQVAELIFSKIAAEQN